ncbi:MAG: KpsF/GutQ family sugar-phosphate isomerase [Bacteroidota bacterium]|nr:KpsF/GutQ family sugar-phosphate isomerase [Bacteroidota bacterium]
MIADNIKNIALQTIKEEIKAISDLLNYIDNDFICAVELIYRTNGRVIVTGIGKSAIIANKIVATFNSTGTPAIFMHAADAIHGDLGIIQKEDIIICISKSGNTPEIKILAPYLKSTGSALIALVGNTDSYLAHEADYIINCSVVKEACPNNLAPTSSTTAQLVMGDALAVCLLNCRGFTSKDFARYHPGGALGKQLYLKVSDLIINNDKPQVKIDSDFKNILFEISSKRLGMTAVINNNKIVGIITDGDLRRMLEKNIPIESVTAQNIMSLNPKTVDKSTLAIDALGIMKKYSITSLITTDENQNYLGVVHLHDIIREGII